MIRSVAKRAYPICLWVVVVLTSAASPLLAQRDVLSTGENSEDRVTIEVIPSHEAVPAGSSVQIGFQIRVEDGWFVHSNTPTYSLFTPVRLMIEDRPGVTVQSVRYPTGIERAVSYAGRPFNIYEETFYVLAEIEFDEQLTSRELNLQMMMNFQACDQELCIPPAGVAYRIPVAILSPDEEPVPLNVERLAEVSQELDAVGSMQRWRPWAVLGILLVVGWMVIVRIRRRSGSHES